MQIDLSIDNQILTARADGPLVAGSVGVAMCTAKFDASWVGLLVKLVFAGSGVSREVEWRGDAVAVPWETIRHPGGLMISVVGYGDGVQKPTVRLKYALEVVKNGEMEAVEAEASPASLVFQAREAAQAAAKSAGETAAAADAVVQKTQAFAQAEAQRAGAEAAREQAERLRANAELQRNSNESMRVTAENARSGAEELRNQAEERRESAHSERETEYSGWKSAEAQRQTADELRSAAELERASAEDRRAAAETERTTAESGRKRAEELRESAENDRQSVINQLSDSVGISVTKYQFADTLIPNTYISRENGEELPYDGWSSTPYLDCHGVDRLAFGGIVSGYRYGFFYDSNRIPISRLEADTINPVQAVPKGAYFFRTSNIDNYMLRLRLTGYSSAEKIEDLNARVGDFSEKISSLSGEIAGQRIISTASGTVAHMDDSANAPLTADPGEPVLTIYGKSTQQIYSGKNLLNNKAVTTTINGITFTVNPDKSVSVSGTASARAMLSLTSGENLFPPGTYVLSDKTFKSSGNRIQIEDRNNKGTFIATQNSKAITFTLSEEQAALTLDVSIRIGEGQTVNDTFFPMIEKGSVATDFEPYCGGIPSPNPEYPQEITSVGDSGSLDVVACGKNLFDGEIEIYGKVLASNGQFNDASTYVISKMYQVDYDNSVVSIRIKSLPDISDKIVRIGLYDKDKQFILRPAIDLKSSDFGYFNIDNNVKFIRFSANYEFWKSIEIQLEIGTIPSAIEPYKSQTATITTGLPYYGLNGVWDTPLFFSNGIGVVYKRYRKIFIKDLFWGKQSTNTAGKYRFISSINAKPCQPNVIAGVGSNVYAAVTANKTYMCSNGISIDVSGQCFIYDENHNDGDVEAWKAMLPEDAYIVYELTEPEIIPMTAEEVQAVLAMQTYKPVTNITADGAEVVVSYVADPKLYIDNKINQEFDELKTAILSQGAGI